MLEPEEKEFIEETLAKFQMDMVMWQTSINQCYNLLITIIKLLIDKGVTTEEELMCTGVTLMKKHSGKESN